MFNIYKKIGWFIKQEWKTYLLMFTLLTLIALLALTPAYVLGIAIDVIVSKSLNWTSFAFLITALILIPVARYLSSYFYNYTVNKTSQKLAFTFRKNYLKKLFDMDAEFYEKYQKGDLISRATADLDMITVAATSMIEGMIFNIGMILIAISIMAITISWELTLISVTIMPIGITILNIIRMKKREYVKKHRVIYAAMTEKILESVEGQKTIRAYVQEENDLKEQKRVIVNDIESWRYIINYENRLAPMFESVYAIAYILAFVFGALFIMQQQMTVGQLVIFISYIGILYGPIISISGVFQQINNATVAVDRFDEIMKTEPDVKDDEIPDHILDFKEIEFRDVTFKYPFDEQPTINQINLTVKKGQTIGVVGPTGSGKSTLIRQLLREFNVTSGHIYIDGKNIKKYKIEDIRKIVGYVPQSHMLFRRGVDDNILIGNPQATIDQLNRAIKIADFEKDIHYLNAGLQTKVGEGGATLSGGQKQRLSIARALVKEPEILILDDSLSAVDANTEETILEQLKKFRTGKTNIIVAHRFSAIRDADLIIVMDQGKIIERGTHEELTKIDGWYKTQYIQQMSMK
ncbi:Probable multidrug resistance ABC transporter ATP-binding/permease protein YheI [Acholeplasma oculi]|uniref:ABC transporter, ATP-binding/permease protein n=1 Tax=Acholeplasma oculi TaxID=35623 RepID=A0A061AB54_9MOLU|nr:ABC transporter ATP-binding protein [Acholeplasma oculi]CDR31083.1 ABC transporter, ATP-binding/permease protein [Acholeplasma oculi]SKC36884.1 ATP-binding cassette, subfamily B [Acholeplasma oculi]SUT90727.1 Probable multidrug resistance ABC transporter ATP-binding/permease protein YheI [Acholeplasma oculi]